MGIFRRLSDLLKSNVNDLIDRAEDPEKMVKQIIIDMQQELTKATQNYGKAKASERLAEKKYLEAQKISASWESKAKAALSQGNADLAKQALAKKVKADEDEVADTGGERCMYIDLEIFNKQSIKSIIIVDAVRQIDGVIRVDVG